MLWLLCSTKDRGEEEVVGGIAEMHCWWVSQNNCVGSGRLSSFFFIVFLLMLYSSAAVLLLAMHLSPISYFILPFNTKWNRESRRRGIEQKTIINAKLLNSYFTWMYAGVVGIGKCWRDESFLCSQHRGNFIYAHEHLVPVGFRECCNITFWMGARIIPNDDKVGLCILLRTFFLYQTHPFAIGSAIAYVLTHILTLVVLCLVVLLNGNISRKVLLLVLRVHTHSLSLCDICTWKYVHSVLLVHPVLPTTVVIDSLPLIWLLSIFDSWI